MPPGKKHCIAVSPQWIACSNLDTAWRDHLCHSTASHSSHHTSSHPTGSLGVCSCFVLSSSEVLQSHNMGTRRVAKRTSSQYCYTPSRKIPVAPSSRARGGGCCCCIAVAGAAAVLEFTAALVALHRASWAARCAARCRSALVGEWASRWRPPCHVVMSLSDASARVLTNDDHDYRGLFLFLW